MFASFCYLRKSDITCFRGKKKRVKYGKCVRETVGQAIRYSKCTVQNNESSFSVRLFSR